VFSNQVLGRISVFGDSAAPNLSLTPALSRWERENRAAAVREKASRRLAEPPPRNLRREFALSLSQRERVRVRERRRFRIKAGDL
jgi:hypothetical protein